ncbi:MAG: hypothetical protein ACLUI7_09965 [Coprococcus sp.]
MMFGTGKSRSNDLVKLASDLIRIPRRTVEHREMHRFCRKILSDAGISYEEVSCNPIIRMYWPNGQR